MEIKTENPDIAEQNNIKSNLHEDNINIKSNHVKNLTGSEKSEHFTFSNKDVRLNFIRKVYLILSCQLIFTTIFVSIVYNSIVLSSFVSESIWLAILSLIVYLVCIILISCVDYAARTVPLNYILLSLLTLSMSYIV